LSFERKAISPELLVVSGNAPTEIPRVKCFPVTKMGVGMIVAIGASKKLNSVFMQDIEEEEEDNMLSRAMEGLFFEDNSADDQSKFSARSKSPKAARSKSKSPKAASSYKTAGLKSPRAESLKPVETVQTKEKEEKAPFVARDDLAEVSAIGSSSDDEGDEEVFENTISEENELN
jgi:hypothetical protein